MMHSSANQRGLSLIELLVAMAIGAVLIFGASQVYVDSRSAYGNNEKISRLQETARYALAVLEPDIRMAGFWGFVKGASSLDSATWAKEGASTSGVASVSSANVCGNNFSVDVTQPVSGFNNRYRLSATQTTACNAATAATTTTSDTLVLRHASATPASDASGGTYPSGILRLCTNRLNGYLFSGGGACGDAATAGDPSTHTHSVNNMIVDAYYVDPNSDNVTGVPSLRRKRLDSTTGLTYVDQEVISGVEDMQIQFGIEGDAATNPDGVVTRYVDPESVPAGAQIVAVRVWLLIRADEPEVGFIDGRTYNYGDRMTGTTSDLTATTAGGKAYMPSSSTSTSVNGVQHYRRMLVSRTIQIRNSMGI